MIRIQLPYIFQIFESIDQLSRLPQGPNVKYGEIHYTLAMAESTISSLVQQSVFAYSFRSSRGLAHQLLNNIRIITGSAKDLEDLIEEYKLFSIRNIYSQYKIAFLAEIGILPAFFVTQKGSHDTLSLLDYPETLFPSDLKTKVPEAMFDVREAGKSLAYDLPTAAGFHIFRATECVLRRYYAVETSNMPRPQSRSMGVYVKMLRKHKLGDEKILASIDQLANLHRNPIIHPEVALSLDEALAIAGIARSIITAMLVYLQPEPATTANAS